MGAIHRLLERLGFVRLDRYGLILTPDGRILSSRPAVLDDGLGGRIVGWLDGDLAAMELQKWEPARPAPKQATASQVAVALAPTAPQPVRPPMPPAAKVVAPAAPVPPKLPGVAPIAQPVVATPAPVAAVEEPEEDWEWTIAMARARAAAEETETAVAAPKFVAPKAVVAAPTPVVAAPKVKPVVAAAKPVVAAPKVLAPKPVVTASKPIPSAPRPVAAAPAPAPKKTAPMAAVAAPKRAESQSGEDWDALIAKASTPRTVIPVPHLPRASNPSMVRPAVVPVARPSVAPLRRVPRATDRIEDTVRTHAAPANDDKTSPGIALPPSGGGRRVAAKQR